MLLHQPYTVLYKNQQLINVVNILNLLTKLNCKTVIEFITTKSDKAFPSNMAHTFSYRWLTMWYKSCPHHLMYSYEL